MALNTSRSLVSLSRQAPRCCRHQTQAQAPAAPLLRTASSAPFSTSSPQRFQEPRDRRPRWSYTPERMKAPFSPHITRDPRRSQWEVNEDPIKLDQALISFLGRDGDRLLPEELKWLAVTHKSFDQGRRGFNDRLAFLGRQLCIYEATQLIISSRAPITVGPEDPFAHRRQPYEDSTLQSINNLIQVTPSDIFTFDKLAKLAINTGLADVIRWKPRMPENLEGSGYSIVLSGAIFSLVGAISLQHGGKVANRIVRDRIIKKIQA